MATSGPGAARADTAARAQNLISMAYQLPLVSRTEWLRAQCTGDDALRREVSWMLEALRAPDDEFLEGRPNVDALDAMPGEISVPAPRDYRLVRPLGEGGMGTVYLAERFDGDYTQLVALKFLNSFALVNPVVVSRFIDERRILAQLSHPNIAHLVDGGTLGDGRPFLAMEYVDGLRIDQDCATRELSQRRRLIQFLKVCGGVDYAHQRLIIHRDIKPANILVGADGEPKLLDFGIARLIDAQGEQTRTEAGLRMMTLAYASPEQIAGEVLTTATDIYSLGVLLYELLTGSRPWRDDVSAADLARQITEGEATPPSVIARRNGTHRPIDGDLDAIVLKALRKEPAQRYGSVRELADDIRNYLDSRPVLARRGHRLYRARKFAFRYRYALSTVAVVVGLVVAFVWDRQMQLERVEAESAIARETSAFLVDAFAVLDPGKARGHVVTAREVLDNASRKIDSALHNGAVVRATLQDSIAQAYTKLAAYPEAAAVGEKAIAGWRAAGAAHRIALAEALTLTANALSRTDRDAEGEALVDEALRLYEAAGITRGVELADALRIKALILRSRTADAALTESYILKARAAGSGDLLDSVRTSIFYATWLSDEGNRAAEAEREITQALERLRGSGTTDVTLELQCEDMLASIAERQGDHVRARALGEKVLADSARLFGKGSADYAMRALSLGTDLASAGDAAAAEPLLRQALTFYRDPAHGADREMRFAAEFNLLSLLADQKRTDELNEARQQLFEFTRAQFGEESFYFGYATTNIARMHRERLELQEAFDAFARADANFARFGDRFSEERAAILESQAFLRILQRRYDDALALIAAADAIPIADASAWRKSSRAAMAAIADVGRGGVAAGNARFERVVGEVVATEGECSAHAAQLREWIDESRRAGNAQLLELAPAPDCAVAASPPPPAND